MPKITITPVDPGPPPSSSAMFVKLFGMVVMTLAMIGVIYMLLNMPGQEKPESWDWQPQDIRTNFDPLYTTKEVEEAYRKKRDAWLTENPITELPEGTSEQEMPRNAPSNGVAMPFSNRPEAPVPKDYGGGGDPREGDRLSAELEMRLAEALKSERVFVLVDEAQHFVEPVIFEDGSREKTMNEFAAYAGRQAPVNEALALQILRKLPASGSAEYAAYAARIDKAGWYFGKSQQAADAYRGLGFAAEGRLFDLYEVKPATPILLQDGTRISAYFEGVLAMIGPGLGRGEHKLEQRTVLFQALTLPEDLKGFVNDKGTVSHNDKLVTEHVMVKLTGPYLRRWVYSREVSPFSSEARKVTTQDHLPLLLTADVARSDMPKYDLTDELLQQVRDSLREDPAFLETEAAYYAMLATANTPDDEIKVVPEIGYFDLAGEETGPRYRGQGVRVVGMLGDNYAPVILPPNISGLRRVFRIRVLHDTSDLNTPKQYFADMIEPPTNLEPRAIITMEARYYRNVFETTDATSSVRPLLIVRQVRGHGDSGQGDAWVYGVFGFFGVLAMLSVLTWFIFSERRERAKFEAGTLEHSRKRIAKRGGLRLKPLPGKDKPPAAPDKE